MYSDGTSVDVFIVFLTWTRRKGTPFIPKGPVMSSIPDEFICFKNTTLFPRCLPVSKINIVPGLNDTSFGSSGDVSVFRRFESLGSELSSG